jgi:hypothetical protein
MDKSSQHGKSLHNYVTTYISVRQFRCQWGFCDRKTRIQAPFQALPDRVIVFSPDYST